VTDLTATDVILPSIASCLLAMLWALMVFPLTYQIAKRANPKWIAWLAGTLATIVVMVGAVFLGGLCSMAYMDAFKNIDISEPLEPKGSLEVILDISTWVILAPILSPLLALIPIFSRWKKLGEKIGVGWA